MGDTIAAIATPQGEGGIGIVRISGDESLNIMKKILRPCPAEVKPRYAYYGNIVNPENENVIDEAICLYMKAPHSSLVRMWWKFRHTAASFPFG